MATSMRPRVLVSAFSCNPDLGSEPGLGFRYIRELAKFYELTVITEELQNRAAIQNRSKLDPTIASVRFVYIPWPKVTARGERDCSGNFVQYFYHYNYWQRTAWRVARHLVEQDHYQLVHHLTMTGYREPGYLWTLELPFVWGPVGGFVMMPWRFLPALGMHGATQCLIRNLLNWVQMTTSWRVKKALNRAAVVFASTSVDYKILSRMKSRGVLLLGENGAELSGAEQPRFRREGFPLKLIWSGLHIPRKALPIALRALASVPSNCPVELHVLGDGPESPRCQALATRLQLGDRCHFHGWLPRERALALMKTMDALVITSLQDAASAVLFEGLAQGLPVITHRCCGFQDVVTDHCGLLIPVQSPNKSIQEFARAIMRLSHDVLLYNRLSLGALCRAGELTWEKRAARIVDECRKIIRHTSAVAMNAFESAA